MQVPKTKIQNFTDLEAWKSGHELTVWIYSLTKNFPKEEVFGISNQLRRASVSITSNLAEGFSRNSLKEKIQFYSIAKGSTTEVENQLLISRDVGFITKDTFSSIEDVVRRTNKLISGLLKSTRARAENL